MFHFVETPFRNFRAPLIFNSVCAILIATILIPASYGWETKGMGAWRLSQKKVIREINAYDTEAAKNYVWSNLGAFSQADDFQTDKLKLLIVGDSQAADLLNMLVEGGMDKTVEIIFDPVHFECGLPYLKDKDLLWSISNPFITPAVKKECVRLMDRLDSTPAIKRADVILVGYAWPNYANRYLKESLHEISEMVSGQLWIVGSKKFSKSAVQLINELGRIDVGGSVVLSPDATSSNEILKNLYGSRFIDMQSLICPNSNCYILTDKYKPVMWDITHFSKEGADFMWSHGGAKRFGFLGGLKHVSLLDRPE